MKFIQYYLDCLSQASYLIGDTLTGQAVIVDPRRDVEEYLDDAKANGLNIVGVLCTHFHADYVSGHQELAAETGAWIGFGPTAEADFEHRTFADGEKIALGDVVLQVLHTPGHTPESSCVVVYENAQDTVPYGVLTGDTLFIGDVGRPDLLASSGLTSEELAGHLYDSLHTKLLTLPDATRVFPAHGAGSACGKNLSTARQSTIGEQKASNYACQLPTKSEFIAAIATGQPPQPQYFPYNVALNKHSHTVRVPHQRVRELNTDEVLAHAEQGAVVLDTRATADFSAGHLPGSLNVPLDGRFAESAAMVIAPDQPIVVLAPEGLGTQATTRLARVGYDNVLGYAHISEQVLQRGGGLQTAVLLTRTEVEQAMTVPRVQVLDVRNPGEIEQNGQVPGAISIPLPQLDRRFAELDAKRPVIVYCAGGWRSSVAASFLRKQGFSDVSELAGGFASWEPQPLSSNGCSA